jgi:hypothetical protein
MHSPTEYGWRLRPELEYSIDGSEEYPTVQLLHRNTEGGVSRLGVSGIPRRAGHLL